MRARASITAALAVFLALPALPALADDSAKTRGQGAAITADQAREIALRQRPGRVEEVDLENDDGRTVWEVEVETERGQDFEVSIDAATGEVLEVDD